MSDSVKNYITPAGHRRLTEELARLWKVDRPKMVETVAWAAGNGDRDAGVDDSGNPIPPTGSILVGATGRELSRNRFWTKPPLAWSSAACNRLSWMAIETRCGNVDVGACTISLPLRPSTAARPYRPASRPCA